MNETLLALLDELARFGTANDARETERPRRMLNITPATGRLLWILVRQARATRILEVGTSNAYSTIWLADAARETGGRVVTLEADTMCVHGDTPGSDDLAAKIRAGFEAAGITVKAVGLQ